MHWKECSYTCCTDENHFDVYEALTLGFAEQILVARCLELVGLEG